LTGWVVEFLIRVRGGEPSHVGYVASGFWGGLTLGRILLADITFRLGERRMIFLYILLALIVQFIFWFVPNIIANAVMISLLGFFIGPFFPTGINVATKLIPRELHVSAIGFMATTGQAGSAAFPFLTGAIAAKVGVQVLQPVLVGLLVGMVGLWAAVPRVTRRDA
jgi:fucose permease